AYRALFSPGHKINARSVSLRNWQRSMRGSHSCSRSFKPKTEYGMSVENSWRRYLCGSGVTPSSGTFDVVTGPVHPNVRDAACASDDTISTDTSADSSRDVCDPVSKLPLVHARIYLLSCPRAYGLAPPAWRAGGVWLRGNALPQIHANRQEMGFPHPLHLPNVAVSG